MTMYELMLNINHRLIAGEVLSADEKACIVSQFLSEAHFPIQAVSFGKNPVAKARRPLFFFPPQNEDKKLKTLLGQMPKTHILNGNMYELEILRLLYLFAPDNPVVAEMITQTLRRLKATCFGYHDCSLGECFDSALVTLRFLATAVPSEVAWMRRLIDLYKNHYSDKKRVKSVERYYELCLSEIPIEIFDSCIE